MRVRAFGAVLALFMLLPAGGAGHPGHSGNRVDIRDYQYDPAEAFVVAGDSVGWTWLGSDTDHSVTADPGQAEHFDSDPQGAPTPETHRFGDVFGHTFTTPGRYTYHCKTHPWMRGSVTVTQAPDRTGPTVRSMRVRPATFCTTRGCTRPRVVVDVTESGALEPEIQRRVRGRWTRARYHRLISLRAGVNRKRLSVAGLRPGRYRLLARASDDAGNASEWRTAGFAVDRAR